MSTRLLFITLILAATAAPAVCHEGHDHSAPSGNWPAHQRKDSTAGGASFLMNVQTSIWKLSDGTTGNSPDPVTNANISNVLADVNTVAFDDDYVYIRTSAIPSHSIGPFNPNNPNVAGDQDATFRVSLNPTPAVATQETGLGNIGVAVNGVPFYNWSDATFWDRASNSLVMGGGGGNWNTNAAWFRMSGFDDAGGHPSGAGVADQGLYHYHRDPLGLEAQIDPGNDGTSHSPIVGFAFDGYPIYGPYAYTNGTDDSAGISQMTSSYQLRTGRPPTGPSVGDWALGSFREDFQYVAGTGTLNEFNMAFVQTPEYPEGTWAYFTTYDLDGSGTPLDGDLAFPFTVGPEYFGEVDNEIIGGNAMINVPDDVTFAFRYVADVGGDFDGDGSLGCADIEELGEAIRSQSPDSHYDVNGDGALDTGDFHYWVTDLKGTIPGDANFDGVTDASDFNIWNENKFATETGWCEADFNGDGSTDASDFNIWNENKFTSATTVVPEPGSLLLVLPGGMSLLSAVRFRRR